jgi:hypothetical protein
MRRALLLLLPLVASACSGDDDEEAKAPEDPPAAPSYVLDITNQSFTDPDVRIVVRIDGEEVVDQAIAVMDQHNVVSFPLTLAEGSHEVAVEADNGATAEATIEIPPAAPLYSNISHWGPDGDGPARLDITTQDEPFLYD